MRKVAAMIGVAALAAAPVALSVAPSAAAHDVLVSSSPADGATVTEPVSAVELTFNNAVSTDFAQVTVVDADEAAYQDGEPEVVGPTVSQAIHELPDGDYTISYRVVSSDGHPITGTISFTVAAGSASEPPAPATTEEQSPPTSEPSPSASVPASPETTPAATSEDDGLGGTTVVLVIVAAAVVVGILAFVAAGGRRRDSPEETGS